MRISRAELARVLPLGAGYALVMATFYVVKPVRSALFLDRLGVGQLPYATIAVAVAGAIFGLAYARIAQVVPLRRLLTATFLSAIALLGVFRLALPTAGAAVIYAFYVFTAIQGLVTTSLVWLLANDLCDARQARRFFGLIGTGGIAGAIAGGLFTRWAVHAIGTEALILVAMATLATSLVLVRIGQGGAAKPPKRAVVAGGALADITSSDLLRGVTIMTVVGGVVSVIVDIQYNDFAARAFATKDEKTAFFGIFFAGLSAFAFLFQVLVTPRVLASRGVGLALLFLPLALAGGSIGLVLVPSLAAAASLKLVDGGLRHSIHKSASEILLVPVPADVRSRTKLFLDTSVGTAAEAAGAALVLVLTRGLGVRYASLAFVSITLIAIWVYLTNRTRLAYVGAFRRALERRELDLGELRTNVVEARALGALTSALGSGNDRAVIYALEMLASVRDAALVPALAPLLAHHAAEIRCKAARVLRNFDDPSVIGRLEPLLRDLDPDVRFEAMLVLGTGGRCRELLRHEDIGICAAAVAFAAEEGSDEERALVDEDLIRSVLDRAPGEEGAPIRAQVARALGSLPKLAHVLRELALDRSPLVVERAIASAGRTRDEEIFLWLVERLGQARYRKQARSALAAFDVVAITRIASFLDGGTTPLIVRLQLARVLAEIPRPESALLLEHHLSSTDPPLVLATIRALNKLRRNRPDLQVGARAVVKLLDSAIGEYAELGSFEPVFAGMTVTPPSRLLVRALREKRALLVERIFRLLGLIHPAREMHDAYHGVLSRNATLRASALEFLDNVLDRRLATRLLTELEGRPTEGRAQPSADRALTLVVEGVDPWLRACAIWCAATSVRAGTSSAKAFDGSIERCLTDPEPIVREAAEMLWASGPTAALDEKGPAPC